MSALAVVLLGLLAVVYARAVLVVLGVLVLVLVVFGCVYVVDVLNGSLS